MKFEVPIDELAHGGVKVGWGIGFEPEPGKIGGSGGNDGANLDFARLLAKGVTRFGHIHFTFVPKGNLVRFDPCGDEAGGDGSGDGRAGAGARIPARGDFDGDDIVGINPEGFPGFGSGGFSSQGREERIDGDADAVGLGIEIREKGWVFDQGDAGFSGGRLGPKAGGEREEAKNGGEEEGEIHEVIKMQERRELSNWGVKACGWAGGGENGALWVFLRKQLKG